MSDERIPKFRITSVDGNTLVTINEKGIIPRGQRADMKLFDDSSGYKVSGSLRKVLSKIKESELKERERQSKMDKLEELCKPISDYLRENYCPYDSIVITDDKIRLVRDEIGIPVNRDSEEDTKSFSELVKEIEDEIYSSLGLSEEDMAIKNYNELAKALEEYLKSFNRGIELIDKHLF